MALSKSASWAIAIIGLILAIAGAACYFFTDISRSIDYALIVVGVVVLIAGAYLSYKA